MNSIKTKNEVWELSIGENVSVTTIIHENPLGLAKNQLFSLGFRYNNTKRSFMFVNKVLGKHFPINPSQLNEMTRKLAEIYYSGYEAAEKTLVIGFAEAATAMAQCFSDAVMGEVSYVHSTREELQDMVPLFHFKEVHSHAPSHNFYIKNSDLIREAQEIVLVDDEVTSGRTALSVIKTINELFPGKSFGLASFLDWRGEEDIQLFDDLRDEGIPIRCGSLLKGEMDLDKVFTPADVEIPAYKMDGNVSVSNWKYHSLSFPKLDTISSPYIAHSGRFGLSPSDKADLEKLIKESSTAIGTWLPEGKTLFLGCGELLYIPLKIAEELGQDVLFQSITRTPNLPLEEKNYDIRSADIFPSPLAPERYSFLYNLTSSMVDTVVLFLESRRPEEDLAPVLSVIGSKGFKSCNVVVLCEQN